MTEKNASDILSELEGCVLGAVARFGPCTAYAVRKEFRSSLTTSWRASAGAIYPVLERLKARGLVTEQVVKGDARGTRKLKVTNKGLAELADWVATTADWMGEPAADPIRTRLQFMDLTTIQQQYQVEAWIERTDQAMQSIDAVLTETSEEHDRLSVAVHRGTWLQLEARKRWLMEIAAELSG